MLSCPEFLASIMLLYMCKSLYCWLFNCEFRKMYRGTLIILRGLPGSGKTEYIKDYLERHKIFDYEICSANDHFWQGSKYKFNPRELPAAHNACLCETFQAMTRHTECVVVNNPNAQVWEYDHYRKFAKHFGYSVYVIEIDCPTEEHVEYFYHRCTYKIPREICLSMRNRWETDSDVVLKTPYSPEIPVDLESESESWSEGSEVSSDSDDSQESKTENVEALASEAESGSENESPAEDASSHGSESESYPGDSLPHPKRTKEELDQQLDGIVSRRQRWRRRAIRSRYI